MFTNRAYYLIMMLALIVTACAQLATPEPATSPAPTEPPMPTTTPDLKVALVGSWTTTVSKEDLIRVRPEFPEEFLCDNAGTFVWQFNDDGTFTIDQTLLPDCTLVGSTHIEDTWSIEGNLFTIAKGTHDEEIYEIAINGDQLTFTVVSSECPPCIAINTANPWTRIEAATSSVVATAAPDEPITLRLAVAAPHEFQIHV
jgi:hypothetical protein